MYVCVCPCSSWTLQVWFQNARAKCRRNAVKNGGDRHSPSAAAAATAAPSAHHHHHHHQDDAIAPVAAAAGAAGRDCDVQSRSVDDVNHASPAGRAVTLLDLHISTINSINGCSGSSSSSINEHLSSPCSVPLLADILCHPSFTL